MFLVSGVGIYQFIASVSISHGSQILPCIVGRVLGKRFSSICPSIRSLLCISAGTQAQVSFLPLLQGQVAFASILYPIFFFLAAQQEVFLPLSQRQMSFTSALKTKAVHLFLGSEIEDFLTLPK